MHLKSVVVILYLILSLLVLYNVLVLLTIVCVVSFYSNGRLLFVIVGIKHTDILAENYYLIKFPEQLQ